MKINLDWTPKDREQRRYIHELYRLDDDPPYVEPPLPTLYTVHIKSGKGRKDGLAIWQFFEEREGEYASHLADGMGNGTIYYFDDPATAFEFKMMFG